MISARKIMLFAVAGAIGLSCSVASADLAGATFPTPIPGTPPVFDVIPDFEALPASHYMYDYVDIGLTSSEAGHAMVGWGPIVGYGGEPNARVVWEPGGDTTATIDMDFGPQPGNKYIAMRWLMGFADDSFDVDVTVGGSTTTFQLVNDVGTSEDWYDLGVWNVGPLADVHTVTFEVTGPAWSGQGTWGQVTMSEIATYVPVPGAFVLGAMGLGMVGWLKRRKDKAEA